MKQLKQQGGAMYRKNYSVIWSILILMVPPWAHCCPTDCECKWKGGKQSVMCVDKDLRTFPLPIAPGTQVLQVSGNRFESLAKEHFMRSGLINLQKIYLARCKLSHIDSRAFRGLSNLVELDLSYNTLVKVPTSTFADCHGLMRLALSGNPIVQIPKSAFQALESLTSLELSNCSIEIVDEGAFEGLLSLEWLRLDGNKLKRLSGLRMIPLALKGIWLEENPWECDCRLLELGLWLQERNVANSVEPRCSSPDRLVNSSLRDIGAENFACTPQLSPTTMYQKIEEGKNVSLLCKVTSIPEASLEWWFNGHPVSNYSTNMMMETSESYSRMRGMGSEENGFTPAIQGAIERKSELFILNSTAEENGTFICIAKNPAGTASANFTLQVLSISDSLYFEDINGLPLFVSTYPNLFITVLSILAVIGVVIILVVLSVLICKCSRVCCSRCCKGTSRRNDNEESSPEDLDGGSSKQGKSGRKRKSRGSGKGTSKSSKNDSNNKSSNGSSGGGLASGVVSGLTSCSGKLDRNLSETSTITTHTKSNGSVFLLSSSSELGDSNPDLIEGVKRVEGDGVETCFSHAAGTIGRAPVFCGTSISHNPQIPNSIVMGSVQQQLPMPYNHPIAMSASATLPHPGARTKLARNHSGPFIMESPSAFPVYPLEYGMPKGLNVATLIRRSPSYPSRAVEPCEVPNTNPLPPHYDLSKYPKEYINPTPVLSACPPIMSSSATASTAVTSSPFYTAYVLSPESYINPYNDVSSQSPYPAVGMEMYMTPTSPAPINCSCTPIIEASESEEKKEEGSSSCSPPNHKNDVVAIPSQPIDETVAGASTTSNKAENEEKKTKKSGSGEASQNPQNGSSSAVQSRLQRQVISQVNESPDEGYEDESAEGTEI